ncbi:MAG: hypothetical protein IJ176_05420 [Prevotella sp.]|nr:hypothetical protein [Prevotella sp.]
MKSVLKLARLIVIFPDKAHQAWREAVLFGAKRAASRIEKRHFSWQEGALFGF